MKTIKNWWIGLMLFVGTSFVSCTDNDTPTFPDTEEQTETYDMTGFARGAVPGDVPALYPRLLVPVHPVDQEAGCDDRLITAPRQRSRPWPLNSWGRSKTGR